MNIEQLSTQIQESLNEIRPYLIKDGGDVEFVEINDKMEVMVRLLGACKECNLSKMTMKAGIEATLKKNISSISAVIAID